jgi:hypothetical protein
MNKLIDSNINEKLKDLDSENGFEFGGFYVGEVVDNQDPNKEGRCRIRVYNVFDEINSNKLPWAIPDFTFIGSEVGSFIVPPNGTIVSVYFENGDIYMPRYTTKVLQKNKLPSNKDLDYPNNMIFFETDNKDSFELNRNSGETKFIHRSGAEIKIDSLGNVSINVAIGRSISINDQGTSVVTPDPTNKGPFVTLPNDTLTGFPLQGNKSVRIS